VNEPLVSVAGLHALVYCERLFYLEEVERIRVADASVFAGRRLHEEVTETDEGQLRRMTFESDELGMRGTVDVLRRRDGVLVVYEHKRGRSAPKREAWESDRVQVGAYAMLVEDALGQRLEEGRVRYHADNVTVRIPIDDGLRERVRTAVARSRGPVRSASACSAHPSRSMNSVASGAASRGFVCRKKRGSPPTRSSGRSGCYLRIPAAWLFT